MDYTCIVLGTVFCIAGIAFACGKAHIHLAAWQAMSEEEKAQVKIGPLCHNIGNIIALSGIIFLLKGLWPAIFNQWFMYAIIIWLILAGFDVWYIGWSKRYRN